MTTYMVQVRLSAYRLSTPHMTHGFDAVCNEVPGRQAVEAKLIVSVPSLSK
jgi:hypothetical protein